MAKLTRAEAKRAMYENATMVDTDKFEASRRLKRERALLAERQQIEDIFSIQQQKRVANRNSVLSALAEKEELLVEALYMVMSESIPKQHRNESTLALSKNIIKEFVKEEGANRLLKSFESKTYFLSEVNRNITNLLDTKIIPEYEDDDAKIALKKSLKGSEVEDIIDTIRTRVSNSLNEFITNNIRDKAKIKEILNQTQEKINNTNKENLKEAYDASAKREINKIRSQREMNILEYMIFSTTKSSMVNEQMKEIHGNADGSVDIDRIVESCVTTYTFLEMLNTMKIKNITESYLAKFLNIK